LILSFRFSISMIFFILVIKRLGSTFIMHVNERSFGCRFRFNRIRLPKQFNVL